MKGKIANSIKGRQILITGGTGSFGKEILKELFNYEPACVSILSRDEKKQYDMQQIYSEHKNLRFLLGDVRDYQRLKEAFRGVDIVYHAAALKQVPNCENAPYEAVRTNVEGAENVRRAAIETGVEVVVGISTDKAVKPVNVMGMSKALQEKIMLQPHSHSSKTRFVCVRYGNVLGSRGSVVPLFCDCILQGLPLPITHPGMTRFQLTLNEAVQLVFWATVNGEDGDLWVKKMPGANIADIAKALAKGMTGRDDYPVQIIGTRPGEKMHEVLVSEEEMWRAEELEEHFLIPSWDKWQRQQDITNSKLSEVACTTNSTEKEEFCEYSSDGVQQLNEKELIEMFIKDGWLVENNKLGPKARLSNGYSVI